MHTSAFIKDFVLIIQGLIWSISHPYFSAGCQFLKWLTYIHHARIKFTLIINDTQESLEFFVLLWGGMSMRALIFCGSHCTPFLDITSQKNHRCTPEMTSSLFNFKLTFLHLCSTFCTVSSWPLSLSSYPTTKISSVLPKTFGMSLNISSIFLWNMWPAGATPNGSF